MKNGIILLSLFIAFNLNAQKIEKPDKIDETNFAFSSNDNEVEFFRCNIDFLYDHSGNYAGAYDSLFKVQCKQLLRIKKGNNLDGKGIQITTIQDDARINIKKLEYYVLVNGKVKKNKIKKPNDLLVKTDSGTFLNIDGISLKSNCIFDIQLYYTTGIKAELCIPLQKDLIYKDVIFKVKIPEIYNYEIGFQECKYDVSKKTITNAIIVGYTRDSGPKRIQSKAVTDVFKKTFPDVKYDEVYCDVYFYEYRLISKPVNLNSGLKFDLKDIIVPNYN